MSESAESANPDENAGRMHFRPSRRVTYSAADCCGGVALGIEEEEEVALIYDVCKIFGILDPSPIVSVTLTQPTCTILCF